MDESEHKDEQKKEWEHKKRKFKEKMKHQVRTSANLFGSGSRWEMLKTCDVMNSAAGGLTPLHVCATCHVERVLEWKRRRGSRATSVQDVTTEGN
jgi:hypothetical protein